MALQRYQQAAPLLPFAPIIGTHLYNQVSQLGRNVRDQYNQIEEWSRPLRRWTREQWNRLSPKQKQRILQNRMPGYRKRPGQRGYGKRRRSYKSKRRVVKKVKRIRKSARKFGNVRSARSLALPLGGFQQRKIIKLKDCMSYNVAAATSGADGTPYVGADGVTPLTQAMIAANDGGAQGKIFQQRFQLNNLRNYYCQGSMKEGTVPNGATGDKYYFWVEPPLKQIPPGQDFKNVLRPLPLSRMPHIINVFKSYTVIGGRITFNIINKTSRVDSADDGDLGGFPIWYAYRITAQRCQDIGDGSMAIPGQLDPSTTYEQLKETGRWRMGSVPYARGAQKDGSKTFPVNWTSKGIFGAEDGLPGAPNVTGVFKGYQKGYTQEGGGSPTPDVTDIAGDQTPTAPNHQVWLQVIWGPQAISQVADPNASNFGAPASTQHTLDHITVRTTSEVYVSCQDPYPIQGVNETDGYQTQNKPDPGFGTSMV